MEKSSGYISVELTYLFDNPLRLGSRVETG